MSKFDEAIKILNKIEWLLDKMSDWLGFNIRERNNEYGTDEHLFKIHKALEIGKLYKTLCEEWQSILREFQDDIFIDKELNDKLTSLVLKIKELENE